MSTDKKAGLRIALRIKFDHIEPITRNAGYKGNIMTFCHRMIDGNIVLVLYNFILYSVRFIGLLGFQGWERNTTAGNDSWTTAMQYVAADRAHIELRAQ